MQTKSSLNSSGKKDFEFLKLSYLEDLMSKCEDMIGALLKTDEQGLAAAGNQELCRIIHSMKGTSAMYGITMVSAICHRFEDFIMNMDVRVNGNSIDRKDSTIRFLDLISRSAEVERNAMLSGNGRTH